MVYRFAACYLLQHHISYKESGIIPAQIYVGLSLCLGLKTNSRLIVVFLLNNKWRSSSALNTSQLECELNFKAKRLFLQINTAFRLVKNQTKNATKNNPEPEWFNSRSLLSLGTLGPRWCASGCLYCCRTSYAKGWKLHTPALLAIDFPHTDLLWGLLASLYHF